MDEFEIECDECGVGSVVHAYDRPDFCPLCGRRAEAEKTDSVMDEAFLIEE